MKVSALKGKQRTISIVVPGDPQTGELDETVKITYRPGALDVEMAEKIEDIAVQGLSDVKVAVVMLEPMLLAWDLENDDGTPWPCDEEHLRKTPLNFLTQILGAIQEDSRPNPTRPVSSENISPPMDAQAPSPNGISSLGPPTASGASPGNSLNVQ